MHWKILACWIGGGVEALFAQVLGMDLPFVVWACYHRRAEYHVAQLTEALLVHRNAPLLDIKYLPHYLNKELNTNKVFVVGMSNERGLPENRWSLYSASHLSLLAGKVSASEHASFPVVRKEVNKISCFPLTCVWIFETSINVYERRQLWWRFSYFKLQTLTNLNYTNPCWFAKDASPHHTWIDCTFSLYSAPSILI